MATAAATALLLLRGSPRRSPRLPCLYLPRFRTVSSLSTLAAADRPARPEGVVREQEERRAPSKPLSKVWMESFRRWKDKETEILADVEPTILLAKEILHSSRYMDGECLSLEDEKAVVERILAHHPRSDDKIGCGLEAIMVDRHPEFRNSRCLFVVRTDGRWIDFSYQKCLRAYIRNKYSADGERFIKEHFKRT